MGQSGVGPLAWTIKWYSSKWLFPKSTASNPLWIGNQPWKLYWVELRNLAASGLRSLPSFFQNSPSRTPVLLFLALNSKKIYAILSWFLLRHLNLIANTNGSSLETHTYLFFFLEYSSVESQTLQTQMPIQFLWGERNGTLHFHFSLMCLHILRMNKGSYLLVMSWKENNNKVKSSKRHHQQLWWCWV